MKRLLSFALVLATTFSAAACSDNSTGIGASAGTYNMIRLGNQAPPATLFYNSSSDHVEILGSRITLYNDGTYTDVTSVQDTQFGSTTVSDERTSGTWTLSGSQLALQDQTNFNDVTYAYVSGNTLSIDNFAGYGQTAVYSR